MSSVLQPYLIVDFDCSELSLRGDESRCDFAFVSDVGNWVSPLEMKKGRLNAGKVVKQLRAGAGYLDSMVASFKQIRFLPIAVIGGKIRRSELDKLRRKNYKIAFRSKLYEVKVLRCHDPISKALKYSGPLP